ncbi:hypothetical protein [Okeania sp. SIO1I7]|uniref:hypothetical protein n=1 Tax=Okeania sp. SIO1I7 TaxID=2607772 RepID=UPI0013FBAD66|nr:hypothetical protein [Okeania sp. SIO1I7]NET24553.1 hypothetical protein [Okeania sp. SIO1I7]
MTELSTEQLLYLLYTFAYSTEGTVTRSTVRNHLSKKRRPNAKQVCESLCELKLLESPKRGRIKVTEMGMKALVINLQTTEYKFRSNKGAKLLNALMACLKLAAKYNQINYQNEDMDFETFLEKFEKLYFEERSRQELRGFVAIRSQEICQKFKEKNYISESNLKKYFEQLKSQDIVFAVVEDNEEIIEWVN